MLYTGGRFEALEVLELAARSQSTMISTIGDAMAHPIAEALLAPDRPARRVEPARRRRRRDPLSTAVPEQLRGALPGATIIDSCGASEIGATGTRPDPGSSSVPAQRPSDRPALPAGFRQTDPMN